MSKITKPLLPKAKFAYNNAKNASTGHISFELNYAYHSYLFYKEDIDLCSKLKLAEKLLNELQKLMSICYKNLYHAQKLQKQVHNRSTKLKSYDSSDKI